MNVVPTECIDKLLESENNPDWQQHDSFWSLEGGLYVEPQNHGLRLRYSKRFMIMFKD